VSNMGGIPNVPGMPSMPSMPAPPSIPSPPSPPSLPSIPRPPAVPSVNGLAARAGVGGKANPAASPNPGNAMRFDFKVDGVDIASFTAVDGLTAEYVVKTYEEGGNNDYIHQLPGRMKYNNLKLTRPVDGSSKALAAWFSELGKSQKLTRRTATVIAYNDNSDVVAEWSLRDVYPVRYTGPSFSAENGKVITETLELAHNGFQM
jgi:phage tail-like protein